MKIAIFSDVLVPPVGGIEQHILTAANELSRRGHEVKIFAPGPPAKDFSGLPRNFQFSLPLLAQASAPAGIFNFQFGLPMPFIWPNFRFAFPLYLYFSLKKWRPEVIHFQTSGPMALAAVILARRLGVRLVGTFHSYFMEPEYLQRLKFSIFNFQFSNFFLPRLSNLLWFYAVWLFNRADVVVSPSAWVATDLKKHGLKRPVRVLHNGADLREFGQRASQAAIEKLKEKYGLSSKVLLYVGRLSVEKSLGVLLGALKILVSQFSIVNCQLIIVGDGPRRSELVKLAQELEIEKRVFFLGEVAHGELAASGLYEVAQVFVTASASENQPLTIIEALAKGLPIVGVAARGVTELVDGNGRLAHAFDAEDLARKILEVLENEPAQRVMGERSRALSRDYDLRQTARELETLYQSLINSIN